MRWLFSQTIDLSNPGTDTARAWIAAPAALFCFLSRFTRKAVPLICLPALLVAQTADPQHEPWKVHIRAAALASLQSEGVVLTSDGVLVAYQGEQLPMPRCSRLSAEDLADLSGRIDRVIETLGEYNDHYTSLFDSEPRVAQVALTFTPSDDIAFFPRYRFDMPFAARSFADIPENWTFGRAPPLVGIGLLEKAWELRESATAVCEPDVSSPRRDGGASQFGAWKLVVNYVGGQGGTIRGVEVDSDGLLVTSERYGTVAPACMRLTDDDLAFLEAQFGASWNYVSSGEVPQRWARPVSDLSRATVTGLSSSSDDPLFQFHLPVTVSVVNDALFSERWFEQRAPPVFVAELVYKLLELRDEASAGCVPAAA